MVFHGNHLMSLTYFVLNLLLQNELKPIKMRCLDQVQQLFRLGVNLNMIEMRINADYNCYKLREVQNRLKILIDEVTMDSLKF